MSEQILFIGYVALGVACGLMGRRGLIAFTVAALLYSMYGISRF